MPDGSLELVDGHLRAETTPDQEVPVLILDIDEAEANKLLATLDPLAALAVADSERLNELLQDVRTSNSAVQSMLVDLVKQCGVAGDDGQPELADCEPMLFPERYEVLVQCADEPQQKELIERLLADGLVCPTNFLNLRRASWQLALLPPDIMPTLNINRSTRIQRTPRVVQLEGLFDVPPAERSELTWQVHLPLEEKPWQIGLIVGPSGCGKTTLAREAFGESLVRGYDWPADQSLVDGFPDSLSMKQITLLLSSVGFSSPPSWLRPFRVLSNGEQFRATIARAGRRGAARGD